MTTLHSYPAYRDSGVEWLGDVPAHWDVRRGGALFTERNETGFPNLPILEVSLVTGVRIRNLDDPNRKQMMSDRTGYKKAHQGDLPYNMMRMWQGAVGVAPVDGLVSPAYVVLQPRNDTQGDYYSLLFRTDAFMGEVKRNSRGIVSDRDRLYWEDFKQLHLAFPPLDEQRAIAAFLDAMDARITRFIAARKKMIRLLEEKKQAVINQAVTKGLDPTVPMKDSGVDWLGEIPAHWGLSRFKFVARVDGQLVDPTEPVYCDMLLIAPNHVVSGTGDLLETETAAEQGADSGKYTVRAGQVIYSKIRPYLRKATIAPTDCLCSADMYPITPRPDTLLPRFLQRLLMSPSSTRYLVDASLRARMPKVNRDALGDLVIAYPTLQEQAAILDQLERDVSAIDKVIEKTVREIDLMQEYRTCLISDVVTGKLDVRSVDLGELPDLYAFPDVTPIEDMIDSEVVGEDVTDAN